MMIAWFRVVAVLGLLAFGGAVFGQGVVVTCDSTTTLLYLLAQRDFGYQTMADMGPYELGQYQDLLESMPEATPEAAASETTPEAAVTLVSAIVEGEDPACTRLREELTVFLSSQLMPNDVIEAADITCDATTVLLALLAQRGYQPEFQSLSEATPEATAETDVILTPLAVEGEDPACVELRADVERHFSRMR